eukprot:TRINITY_DN463_c0_g1_i1.p1 TRINITY_DN463_c0_g1~~TRINITY_DN463_c0_g1_i1.p1  ORF type:complete len:784 (-),score=154.87 TRINITY_DN463_c0_g1_i1:389-2740(-)
MSNKAVIFTAPIDAEWFDEIVPICGRRRTQSNATNKPSEEKGVESDDSGLKSVVRNVPSASYMKSIDISPTGGNPGAFRQTVVQSEDDEGVKDPRNVYIKNLNNQAIYDPSLLGPITSIECTFDVLNVEIAKLTKVQYSLLIEQDGALFQSSTAKVPRKKVWRGFVLSNLGADDFDRLPGSTPLVGSPGRRHPNFVNGGPVRFGYLLRASAKATAIFAITGIDNWRVTLVTKRVDMNKSKDLARSLQVERSERQKLESQLKEEREKAETLLRQSRSIELSCSVSPDYILPRPTLEPVPSSPLGDEEAKRKQYTALLAAARKRIGDSQSAQVSEREKWNHMKASLSEKQLALEKELEAERAARASQQMLFSSQFEEVNAAHVDERQKLERDRTEKDEQIQEYSNRIGKLEGELRNQNKSSSALEKLLQQSRAELQSLKMAAAGHIQDKARIEEQLSEVDKALAAVNSQFSESQQLVHDLQAQLRAKEEELKQLEEQRRDLVKQCKDLEEVVAESRIRIEISDAEHKRQFDDLKRRCGDLCEELEKAYQEHNDLRRRYESECSASSKRMGDLERDIQQLTAERGEIGSQLDQERLDQKETQNELLNLSARLSDQTQQASALRDEAAIVSNQLAAEMAKRVQIEGTAAELEERLKRSENCAMAERERVATLEMEIDSLRSRHTEECAMTERVASEMMATLKVHEKAEHKQAATIEYLTDQLRKQAHEMEEAINAHVAAREKAENALRVETANRESAEAAVEQLSQLLGMGADDDTWEVVAPSNEPK